ncbi:MAG TPA: S26 family signal peptidase, partial [Gemmataceae bacterium]|nr:S26 family signal peptidase [Gemmataceae bacterium]
MARWTAGLVLVLVCGWGLILAAALLAPSVGINSLLLVVIAAAISFGLLWVLERNLWLSRFMGLRLSNVSAQWKETAFLWVTGVVGLLFRSTETPRPDPSHVQPSAENSSVREIAETIVFVVVLVLLLKTFAAEAFVIPTGSMATTLWGYQKYVKCPKCGYQFPVNCSREVEGTGDELGNQNHIATEGAICPNCHYPIDFVREGIRPSCQTGDRVLVDKPLYDIHMANPTPMDVVVFKYPEAPQSDYTPMNYIKRLAGTGGHTYGIYYGKLYVGDPNKVPNWDDADKYPDPELERRPDQSWDEAVHEWKSRYKQNMKRMMHTGEYDTADLAGRLKEGKDFTIFRRPLHAVLAQRRIVYDNDHPASDLPDAYQRWIGGADSRWANANDHGFHHDAGQGEKVDWLRYRNVLRCSPTDSHGKPRPELITDIMGYNTEMTRQGTQSPGENWVGDLMFECDVNVEESTGELVLEMSKGIDRFRARWDLATGTCTLLRATGDQNDSYRVNTDDDKAFKALGEPQSTS